MSIGLLHPGEMGAAVGAALRSGGQMVLWASAGRSAATAKRADEAGLEDAGSIEDLASQCDVIVNCQPTSDLRPSGGFS
jgi:3-hydroxyisobutyrate dehydrogenase-like beta-hydroxyacid dehydrogenase